MYLKSLEISGFKSFAKKSTLTFVSPITAIIGPNGSGKSNIAEAFQFVMGEQSMKSLRGKRGEDLIWNGAGETGRANRAQVKLVFDNSRQIFPGIDFETVSVERAVMRDNTHEYNLNGSQVRLKDITELLAGAHIGATGHHIISQGEADRILTASIRERREMIEDALGLKIYQWKKLESLRKLERTEENMEKVESLRREIAPHIKFLKKQVEKVEKAEILKRELTLLYKEYFKIEETYLNKEKARLTAELVEPKQELAILDADLEKAKNVLNISKNKDRKSQEIIDIENKLAKVRGDKDTVMRELGRIEGEMSAIKKSINRELEHKRSEENRTVYLKDLEGVVVDIEKFSDIIDVKQLFSKVVSTLRDFIIRHRLQVGDVGNKDNVKEVGNLESKKERLDAELNKHSKDENDLNREYHDLRSAIEKEKDTDRAAEKEVFTIIARQNEVRYTINSLSGQLEVIERAIQSFKQELSEAGIIAGRDAVNYTDHIVNGEYDKNKQEERKKNIEKNKIRLEDSTGLGGSDILKEFRETEERDVFLLRELEDLKNSKEELLKLIADLDLRIDIEFKTGILKINTEFQKYFTLMFGGGKAELSVVKEVKRRRKSDLEGLSQSLSNTEMDMTIPDSDPVDEETGPEGLEVNINLPRKKIKSLMMLSGGERALTSIALLFAISQVNPPPFIILDETDAALDEANSKKYADMIEKLSEHSQLILITHNRETMSRAGVLYGITMGSDGGSKLLSISFEEAVKVAK